MKIIIVGGGSSGWLVASALIKKFPKYQITLVESPNIPTIGVGESTTTLVRNFIKHYLKIDEADFLKKTDGIFKMSVRFNDFVNIGEFYDYPFGSPFVDSSVGVSSWDLVKNNYKNLSNNDFVKFSYPSYSLFSKNKISKNEKNEFDNFNYNLNLGYHFDANKLGEYLKNNFCIPRGVKHVIANVKDIKFYNDEVECVILENDYKIYGELFIDCTGFKSIILGNKMKPNFIKVSNKLLNNSAWATPVKYKNVYKEMQPYTTATAIENGWCWYTPIASRIGNGYAYSEDFVDSDNALKEFKKYLLNNKNYNFCTKEVEELPFFQIKMKTGFYEKSMIKNVVGIGMSSGFLEPLEGTGLHFIIEQVINLFKIIENGFPNQFLIDAFNLKIKDMYETWTDSLLLIYLLTKRKDTEYWKHVFNMSAVDFNFKNQNHYHDTSDYSYRALSYNGHNFVNDLFNNAIRGSGIINNINDFDETIISLYNNAKIKSSAEFYFKEFNKNLKKWEKNSNDSLHIYDFLIKENMILEANLIDKK
jgi:hypothetical protein